MIRSKHIVLIFYKYIIMNLIYIGNNIKVVIFDGFVKSSDRKIKLY